MGDAAQRIINRLGNLKDLVDIGEIKKMVTAQEPALREDLAKIRERIARLTSSVANNDALKSVVSTA